MTDEDRTAARLKGYNCLIKFKDGEELLLKIDDIDDEDSSCEWFLSMDRFINSPPTGDYIPVAELSIAKDTIKYVQKI